MIVTPVGIADLQIDCFEDREGKGLVGSYRVPLDRVREEIVAVARAVVTACRERNWKSKDLEHLSGLLTNPWLEPTL